MTSSFVHCDVGNLVLMLNSYLCIHYCAQSVLSEAVYRTLTSCCLVGGIEFLSTKFLQFLLPRYIHNVYKYIHTYIPIHNALAKDISKLSL